VYRSRQGIDGTWQLLADYDVADSHTPKAVSMRYVRGGSVLQFGFAGFWGSGSDTLAFTGNDYVVEFQSDSTFTVLNAAAVVGLWMFATGRDRLAWKRTPGV